MPAAKPAETEAAPEFPHGYDGDSVYFLIADHARAFADFEVACFAADEMQAKADGRVVSENDRSEYERADAVEQETFNALLSARPKTVPQFKRWVDYLSLHHRGGFTFERDELETLFQSLSEFSPRRH